MRKKGETEVSQIGVLSASNLLTVITASCAEMLPVLISFV